MEKLNQAQGELHESVILQPENTRTPEEESSELRKEIDEWFARLVNEIWDNGLVKFMACLSYRGAVKHKGAPGSYKTFMGGNRLLWQKVFDFSMPRDGYSGKRSENRAWFECSASYGKISDDPKGENYGKFLFKHPGIDPMSGRMAEITGEIVLPRVLAEKVSALFNGDPQSILKVFFDCCVSKFNIDYDNDVGRAYKSAQFRPASISKQNKIIPPDEQIKGLQPLFDKMKKLG